MKPRPTRFKPSFTSEIRKEPFLSKVSRAPFISYSDPNVAAPNPNVLEVRYEDRFQHIYIPGKIGRGKSTLLHAMAYLDIKNGAGVTVIDPKGDLVASLLDWIPESRKDDAIYLDLETPVPLDFLSYSGENEKDELVADIIFLLLNDAGNAPRAKAILTDVLYTILGTKEPTSFLDIFLFLTDESRQKKIIDGLTDLDLIRRWKPTIGYNRKIEMPKDEKIDPILSRMNKYVRNRTLRKVFDTPNPKLNIGEIINNRKILLINLGGASRAAMDYGSLVFQKMKQEVFRRHKVREEKRVPHFLFIDEFQAFANVEDFRDVLNIARGYKLAMTLANPTVKDLPEHIKSGIGIVGSYIIFRLAAHDIPFFQGEIPPIHTKPVWKRQLTGQMGWEAQPLFDLSYLSRLSTGEALYHLADGRTFIKQTPGPPPKVKRASYAEYIKKRTIDKYSCATEKTVIQSTQDASDSSGNANDPAFLPKHPQEPHP